MSEDAPQSSVAWLKHVFLPPSEYFIANQLLALRRYRPIVLAASAPNPMGVPAETLRSLDRLGIAGRGLNRLALKITHSAPYWEQETRRSQVRLLHAQFGAEGLTGVQLKARLRVPLITSFLGYDAYRLPRRRPRQYDRLFAEGDLFLPCSEVMRQQLLALGCPEERTLVQHLAVDTHRIPFIERKPPEDGRTNVLLVGRLVEKKGIPYAIQAFASVRRFHRKATLTIIGEGPLRPAITAQLRELSLGDVRLLGAQPHDVVLAEMQRAHIFVLPSVTAADGDSEGIPVTLMEAMASGLPVISTWHAGIPELVADGRCGYLVSERNSHALAERLRHLIEHPEKWKSFGLAGRAIVEERFSLDQQTARLEAIYGQLLAGA
ncbi:MAG: glycosyltransferase [Anaerolineae bacterium]